MITLQKLPRSTVYSMRAVSAANDLRPAFGGSVQRIARKGSRWAVDVSVPSMAIKRCGPALISDLVRGEAELIRTRVPEGADATPYGSPLVAGGGQSGSVLNADNFPPHTAIRKGKFFSVEIGGQSFLYMVDEEVIADGDGVVSLPIWPMLRLPPADNAALNFNDPMIEGFIAPGQEWSISNMRAVGMGFTIEERE